MNQNWNLPEIASLMAIYLRDLTGKANYYARVILPTDPVSCYPDGLPYIAVGDLFRGEENEIFNVFSPDNPDNPGEWTLLHIVSYPATRWEPAGSDASFVLRANLLPSILAKMAELLFNDRLVIAQQCFYNDLHFALHGCDA